MLVVCVGGVCLMCVDVLTHGYCSLDCLLSCCRYTHANTRILTETSALTARMHRLEKGLNSTAGAGEPASNNDPALKKDAEERRKLVHLVRLQAREVDALKAEIMMLRRKGGHIYANYSANNRPPQ